MPLAHEVMMTPEMGMREAYVRRDGGEVMVWLTGFALARHEAQWSPWGLHHRADMRDALRQTRWGVTTLSCTRCTVRLEVNTEEYVHAMLRYNAPHACPEVTRAARP